MFREQPGQTAMSWTQNNTLRFAIYMMQSNLKKFFKVWEESCRYLCESTCVYAVHPSLQTLCYIGHTCKASHHCESWCAFSKHVTLWRSEDKCCIVALVTLDCCIEQNASSRAWVENCGSRKEDWSRVYNWRMSVAVGTYQICCFAGKLESVVRVARALRSACGNCPAT